MSEGLFPLGALRTPFDQEAVAAAIVRLQAPIYYVVTVFPDRESLAAFHLPPADRPTHSGRKVFLDQGVVLWYLSLTRADLARIASDAGRRLLPALYEAVGAVEGVGELPAQRVVPLTGGGTAFCVGRGGQLLTNYHVAREEIEAARRTDGADTPMVCRYLGAATAGGRHLPGLRLLRNPSEGDAGIGLDWTLLQLPGVGLDPLPLAGRAPEPGEPVWVFGFPMRTARGADGYPDADGGLRVASGRVLDLRGDHLFVADLDGASGNSGGPVVDAGGAVLGIVHAVDPPGEHARRSVEFHGGMRCVRGDHPSIREALAVRGPARRG